MPARHRSSPASSQTRGLHRPTLPDLIVDPGVQLTIQISPVPGQCDLEDTKWRRLLASSVLIGRPVTWWISSARMTRRGFCAGAFERDPDRRPPVRRRPLASPSCSIRSGKFFPKGPVRRNFGNPPALDNRVHVEGRTADENRHVCRAMMSRRWRCTPVAEPGQW